MRKIRESITLAQPGGGGLRSVLRAASWYLSSSTAARRAGDFDPESSDINLLIVLRHVALEIARKIAADPGEVDEKAVLPPAVHG